MTSVPRKEKVAGIGGVFFKAKDADALRDWYREHLGVELTEWGGAVFECPAHPEPKTTLVWSVFKGDSDYFAPSEQSFMINYRVESLDRMLAQLREAGVEVVDKIEESEFGRFGWAFDPEGNKLELWQPPEGR